MTWIYAVFACALVAIVIFGAWDDWPIVNWRHKVERWRRR